jgi:hypothetical protein
MRSNKGLNCAQKENQLQPVRDDMDWFANSAIVARQVTG